VGRREGVVVVIEGTAGIGKSRLLEVARSRGSELGFRVLSARATELEQGFPYGVVRQLFERLLSCADAGDRERWLSGVAAPRATARPRARASSVSRATRTDRSMRAADRGEEPLSGATAATECAGCSGMRVRACARWFGH
jgi:hypothetical protein